MIKIVYDIYRKKFLQLFTQKYTLSLDGLYMHSSSAHIPHFQKPFPKMWSVLFPLISDLGQKNRSMTSKLLLDLLQFSSFFLCLPCPPCPHCPVHYPFFSCPLLMLRCSCPAPGATSFPSLRPSTRFFNILLSIDPLPSHESPTLRSWVFLY